MNDNDEMRAPQYALALPEIISIIFEWIDLDYLLIRPLYYCGLVNRLWFHQAMRYVWKVRLFCDLSKSLEKVVPQRRQFYANFIEHAKVCLINDQRIPHYDAMLRELRFPRLQVLSFSVERDHKESQEWQCHIPQLGSHQITLLVFDFDCGWNSGLIPHEMDQIIDQIPAAFPQLEYIDFENRPKVNKGAFKRLKGKLPRLRSIDHPDWWRNTD